MSQKRLGMAKAKSGRRDPRLPIELPALLSGRSPHEGRVVDLSLSGCLVRSELPLDPGAILDLRLDLEGEPLSVKVRVAEASLDGASLAESPPRFLAGLQFLGLSGADELRLRSFLQRERKRRRNAGSTAS